MQRPAGQWNDWWCVLARDNKVRPWCNGKQVWEATRLKPAKGHSGPQAGGAPLEFRDPRIREIKD